MRRSPILLTSILAAAALPAPAPASPVAALRGDANRNGTVDLAGASDIAAQSHGSVASGVLVLPNVDDDSGRCQAELPRVTAKPFTAAALAACNDGSDDVVNGADDASDLAEIHVLAWPEAPDDARGRVSLTGAGAGHARLFRRDGDRWSAAGALSAADLRRGVALGLEATDIARDGGWDGRIDVALEVTDGSGSASDRVAAHVAPLLLVPQTAAAQKVLAHGPPSKREIAATYEANEKQARRTATFLRTAKPKDVPPFLRRYLGRVDEYLAVARRQRANIRATSRAYRAFDGRLRTAMRRVGLLAQLTTDPDADLFVQDQFESGYASVPVATGSLTMRIALLSSTPIASRPVTPKDDRAANVTWPFRALRGPGAAVLVSSTPKRAWTANGDLEATPPVPGAPRGRLLIGSDGNAIAGLLGAQGVQSPLRIDTSWLQVGHLDEIFAIVPAATARGWALVVADPAGALRQLRAVPARERGRVRVVANARRFGEDGRERRASTVRQLLDGPVADQSRQAQRRIDAQLAIVRRELALEEGDIARVPVLFGTGIGEKRLTAWTGNIVNGFAPGGRRFLGVAPHGPVRKGRDLFVTATEQALEAKGIAVTWVDTWPAPHTGSGELHCFTNALRDLGDGRWW